MEYKKPGLDQDVVKTFVRGRIVMSIIVSALGTLLALNGLSLWLGSQPVAAAVATGFGLLLFALQAVASTALNSFETVASLALREMRNRDRAD